MSAENRFILVERLDWGCYDPNPEQPAAQFGHVGADADNYSVQQPKEAVAAIKRGVRESARLSHEEAVLKRIRRMVDEGLAAKGEAHN